MKVILRTPEENAALKGPELPRMMDKITDAITDAENENGEVSEIRLTRREARKLAHEAYRARILGVRESMLMDGIIPDGTYMFGVRLINDSEVSE